MINCEPHTGINMKTPYELLSGKPVDYSNLWAFGCTVYYHVNDGKLDPRAKKGVFVDYGDGVKGYWIWSPSEKRVILSRNDVFDENSMFNPTLKFTIPEDCGFEKQVEQRETETTCKAEEGSPHSHSEAEGSVVPLESGEHHNIALNHPKRSNFGVPPTRYGYEDMVSYAL